MKSGIAAALIILSVAFAAHAASNNIIALQGRAVNATTGQLLASGDVTLKVYTQPADGTLTYEENFTNVIFNGTFNIVAGNATNLSLLYNTRYWMEIYIGSIEVIGDGTGSGRQPFYPTSGPLNAGEINLSTGGTIETRLGVIFSNMTAVNTTLSSDITALNLTAGSKYNTSGGILSGNFNASGYFGDFSTLNVRSTSSFGDTITSIGNILIGGGYGAGGITLQTNGDIFTNGSLFLTGNITVQDITNINITGGFFPSLDDNFDIGSSLLRWNAIYLTTANITGGNYNASGYADINDLNARGLTNYY